jgi:site-specific DNA-cytosine methylase
MSAADSAQTFKRPAAADNVATANAGINLPIPKMPRRTTVLRYAADFAGLGTVGRALKILTGQGIPGGGMEVGISIEHMFSCDNDPHREKMLMDFDPPTYFFSDVRSRARRDVLKRWKPQVGIYSMTAPCQGLSPAGLGMGEHDDRTKLSFDSMAFIREHTPRAVIMEQSSALSFCTHERLRNMIIESFKTMGYVVEWALLQSDEYVPQNRLRFYLVGIRAGNYRKDKNVKIFPETPQQRCFELKDIIKVLPDDLFCLVPDISKKTYYRNVTQAIMKASSGPGGVNPYVTPIVVDQGASEKFAGSQINRSPTLTFSRAKQFGYWATTKGGTLDLEEMIQIQGFPKTLASDAKRLGIPGRKLAGMIGNAQTLPLVSDLLPHVLYKSSMISLDQFKKMKVNHRLYFNI